MDLEKTQHQQTEKENALAEREAAIQQREMELLQREFQMALIQQQTPTPKKRKSNFKKKFKDKKSSGSNIISGPSGKDILLCELLCELQLTPMFADFRHNYSLTPSRTEMSKTELSLANGNYSYIKFKLMTS